VDVWWDIKFSREREGGARLGNGPLSQDHAQVLFCSLLPCVCVFVTGVWLFFRSVSQNGGVPYSSLSSCVMFTELMLSEFLARTM
jgi:hypothetical protein